MAAAAFPLPSRIPSWFAGHMASSLRTLPSILQNIDLVVEVRDARLPLTSVNPAFEQALGRAWGYQSISAGWDRKGKGRELGVGTKEKVVVYTKRDLAERRYEEVRLTSIYPNFANCLAIEESVSGAWKYRAVLCGYESGQGCISNL
jgi:hypothetical protein